MEEVSEDERSPEKRASAKLSARKAAQYNEKHERTGIVYMSRVPPHLKPLKLRQMLECHAKIGRIYMAPKDKPTGKKKGGQQKAERGKEYSEAWVEFLDKKVGRGMAELLNGTQMGGKHRSRYHDDLWTLKYLPKFKWDHLTEEIAYQKAVKEKKFAMGLSEAKKERDFYLGKVAEAKKFAAIADRKRKREGGEAPEPKKLRTFQQREAKSDASQPAAAAPSSRMLALFQRSGTGS